ncbi:MFS general substrate transporter [Myriangium duriaei CBS 260.36]|uniref:MFS general substrate transporter n=1 Tax=Myriangium duriaei CBS 260.36 TaxID=1168546 RepID=A0A9P4MER6_9PEZI|nr:MFS general substrate transporter [Myriangium duriaei CBS 260.36]
MFAWLNGSDHRPPAFLAFRSSKLFIVGSVAAAVFTDLFLYGIVVPVLPFALSRKADVPKSEVQKWISILLAVYGAALFIACPFCGWYADNSKSRKRPLLIGLIALAGATAILTIGNSIVVLIVGRILQGFSAAVVWVVGLALVADTVGADGVGEAMGYLAIAMSVGTIISPLIGGVVFARAGYYAVFVVSFALLALDIALRLLLIEKKVAERWLPATKSHSEADDPESELITSQLTNASQITNDQLSPTTPETLYSRRSSRTGKLPIAALPSVVDRDGPELQSPATQDSQQSLNKPKRKLPTMIVLLKSRRLLSSCIGCMIQSILLTSFDSTVPIFVHKTFHWNSEGAGIIFLPLAVPAVCAPLVGWMADRWGPRYLTAGGFLACAPFIILLRLITENTIDHKVLFCALLALLGTALTFALTPIMAEITYCVEAMVAKAPKGTFGEKGAMAQAYGLFNMAFAAGSMLGPLLGGLIVEGAGWKVATLVLGILSAVWAVPTWYWTGGSWRRQRNKKRQENDTEMVD